jgi:hypothetical protein
MTRLNQKDIDEITDFRNCYCIKKDCDSYSKITGNDVLGECKKCKHGLIERLSGDS